MAKNYPAGITAVTEVYGGGQKLTAAAIEYPREVAAADLAPDAFRVEGFTVTGAYPSNGARGLPRPKGRCVVLTLDTLDPQNTTLERVGRGPFTRLRVHPPRLTVSQTREVRAANGEALPPFEGVESASADNGIVDRFAAQVFQVPGTGEHLDYHLYIPDHLMPGHRYPLVLFMHDAGACSDDRAAPLAQGSGALVWARDAAFGRRPCFVVAPHYPTVCANDDFEVTWQADATVALVRSLLERYPVDAERVYGTGQSMGCMMLCEMTLQNPGFFAGCLLVAGQWSPERMAAARNENLWAVVAAGDAKAYPIMGKAMRNMAKAGGKLSQGCLDARADASVLDAEIRRQKAQGANLNFTWFGGKGILPPGAPDHPGMHHVATWGKAYDIKALREWLFEQRASRRETL
jgi:predicted peptidase